MALQEVLDKFVLEGNNPPSFNNQTTAVQRN